MSKLKFLELVLSAVSALLSTVKATIKLIEYIFKFKQEPEESFS